MKFLPEKPIKQDLLDGQSHDLLSDAIATEILSDEAFTIGLDGELGSGKSSVIEMVKEKTKDSEIAVEYIDFDVELYHNNNVSKALINTIYDKLSGLNEFQSTKVKRDSLKRVRDEALGYIVKYSREVDSPLSGALGIFAVSLLILSEVFIDFLKSLAESFNSIGNSQFDPENAFIIGAFVIFSITILYSASKARQNWGNLVAQKVPETIKDTMEVSTEIGSYELHKALNGFKSLLKKDRTVVLVIDNLDRVPQESFLQVWSDLEVFTHITKGKDYSGNLKLLIPFSSSHVANSIATTVLSENDDREFTSSKLAGYEFISKRIPIQFKLPKQVNADWKSLTKKLLEDAELQFSTEEFSSVVKLIESWKPSFQPAFTPRYIKFLINEMVSILKIQPALNKLIVAAYVCIMQDEKVTTEQLLGLDISEENSEIITSLNNISNISKCEISSIREEFAKIHFQTKDGEVAISELLLQKLKGNLVQNDIRSFCFHERYYYPEALKDVFESIELSEHLDILSSFNFDDEALFKSWLQKFFSDYLEYVEDTTRLNDSNLIKALNSFSNVSNLLPEETLSSDRYMTYINSLKLAIIEILKSEEYEEPRSSAIVSALYNITRSYDLKLDTSPLLLNKTVVLNTCTNDLEAYSYWEGYFDTQPQVNRKVIIETITQLDANYNDSVGELFRRLIKSAQVGGSFFLDDNDESRYELEDMESIKLLSEREVNIVPEAILFTKDFVNQSDPFPTSIDANVFVLQNRKENELHRAVAALLVYYINVKDLNRAASLVAEYSTELESARNYISLYMQLCMSFSSILTASKNIKINEYVIPALMDLIRANKVQKAMTDELFSDEGKYICELFSAERTVALNFINGWTGCHIFKTPKELIDKISPELLGFCIEAPNSDLSQTLLAKYDEYTKTRDWFEEIHSLDTLLNLENKLYRSADKFRSSYSQINNTVKSLINKNMECDFELQALPDLLSTLQPKAKEKLTQYCSDLFWSDDATSKIREWMLLNVPYLLEKPRKWNQKSFNKLLNLVDFSEEQIVWGWAKESLTESQVKSFNKNNVVLYETLKNYGKLDHLK